MPVLQLATVRAGRHDEIASLDVVLEAPDLTWLRSDYETALALGVRLALGRLEFVQRLELAQVSRQGLPTDACVTTRKEVRGELTGVSVNDPESRSY